MITYICFFFLKELVTLKTVELYQTMQKAQELAQRLKQEQRIRELAQKGHDISKLQKNLGGGKYKSFHIQFAYSFGVCMQVGGFCFGFFSPSAFGSEIAPLLHETNFISAYLKKEPSKQIPVLTNMENIVF